MLDKLLHSNTVNILRIQKESNNRLKISVLSYEHCLSHPHGDTDGTVHVAFIQPAMFGDTTFLGSEGSRILQETEIQITQTHTDTAHAQIFMPVINSQLCPWS